MDARQADATRTQLALALAAETGADWARKALDGSDVNAKGSLIPIAASLVLRASAAAFSAAMAGAVKS